MGAAPPTQDAGRLHVVYGAGPLGRHVADAAARAGHRVTVVTRTGAGVPGAHAVAGDAADPAGVRALCAQAAVVYNCAQPPYHRWPEQFPPIQRGLIEGLSGTDAVLVAAENLYLYGAVTGPITEDLPSAAHTAKGAVRSQMAAELAEAHRAGRVRTTSGRASDFFGPHVEASFLGKRVFAAAARGRTVRFPADPSQPHTYTYVGDLARALVTLGEHERAWGRAWHVPSPPALTTEQIVAEIAAVAGTTARVRAVPRPVMRAGALVSPLLRETLEMLYEFERPFVVDDSAIRAAFGLEPTPLGDAIAHTLMWLRGTAD